MTILTIPKKKRSKQMSLLVSAHTLLLLSAFVLTCCESSNDEAMQWLRFHFADSIDDWANKKFPGCKSTILWIEQLHFLQKHRYKRAIRITWLKLFGLNTCTSACDLCAVQTICISIKWKISVSNFYGSWISFLYPTVELDLCIFSLH